MAMFIKKSTLTLFPRFFKCILSRTKHYATFRQSNYFRNLKFNHKIFIPILSADISQDLRNRYCAKVFYSSKSAKEKPLNLDSLNDYENVSEETLQSLYDRFEEILQNSSFEDWDVNYSNGVLTVTLEKNFVYVINKQTPNRQIWLSSPVSGPKRYDYVDGIWIYKHDGFSLHQLLSNELTQLLQKESSFLACTYSS